MSRYESDLHTRLSEKNLTITGLSAMVMCICTKRQEEPMFPRWKKPRHCQCSLKGKAFKPTGVPMSEVKRTFLSRNELEALKLCDFET
jgi:hypothetical protein